LFDRPKPIAGCSANGRRRRRRRRSIPEANIQAADLKVTYRVGVHLKLI
jgi:hypothetical protein